MISYIINLQFFIKNKWMARDSVIKGVRKCEVHRMGWGDIRN